MVNSNTRERAVAGDLHHKRFRHVRELDGIRGIAALGVLCHHLFFTNIAWNLWPQPERWAGEISRYGQYGVDLFFVLSGFLITSLLFQDRDDPHYYHNFYWKRALRILPLYIVLLVMLVVFDHNAFRYALLCAVFLANFAHLFKIPFDGPYWTLAIEEQFYLVWPRIVHRKSVGLISNLALAIVIIELVVRLISAAFGHVNFVFTFYRCDGLACGALLACQSQSWRPEPLPRGKRSFGVFRWVAAGGLSLAAICVMLMRTDLAKFGPALLLSAISLLFYGFIGGVLKHSGSAFLLPFRSGPLSFFGDISYCLYMVHPYVLNYYDSHRGTVPPGHIWQYFARASTVLAISVGLCMLSRYTIERPAQSLRKYILHRKPAPTVSESMDANQEATAAGT